MKSVLGTKIAKRILMAAAGMAVVSAVAIGVWSSEATLAEQGAPAVVAAVKDPAELNVGKGIAAKNPVTLSIIVDQKKVLGWISGTRDYTGKQVKIECEGKSETVLVQEGNAFTWHYKVDKKMLAAFTVDGMKQMATIDPAAALEPTAFFVIDRSVYRPGQDLKFAGFLRRVDENGEFVPAANQSVDVQIISERKKTTATKMKLTSDDMGRIEGSYHWSEGDVIDDYTISINGFKGTGAVALAEYRKSKIKLKIAGKAEGDKMKLRFDAVDFLDNAVPGSKLSFVAQVVKNGETKNEWTLKGEEFVYSAKANPWINSTEDLTEDETLMAQADDSYVPMFGTGGKMVVLQQQQEMSLEKGTGDFTLDLRKEWLAGRYLVEVQGVLIDANGREQRATETISLNQSKQRLNISIPKRVFAPGETINITTGALDEKGEAVKGTSTLVAMKLSAGQVINYATDYWGGAYYLGGRGGLGRRPAAVASPQGFQRTLATATAVVDGKAQLQLSEAGAYKLVVVTQLGEGKSITDEIGCVVRDSEDLPGLTLTTNKKEYVSGETLEAEVQSRFTGAKVLVTLRDSNGVRWWKPVEMKGQVEKLTVKLPEDLKYACDLAVQYVEGDGKVHVADQVVRVRPESKFITVKTEMAEQVKPGETVKLKFNVNRTEPVDLVVSVYDQSLLGIKSDKQADVRNFYYADERALATRDRDLIRRRLGHLTMGQLVEQAESVLKEKAASTDQRDVTMRSYLQGAVSNAKGGYLSGQHAVLLLRVAGIPVQYRPYYSDGFSARFEWKNAGTTRIADLMETSESNQWYLLSRYVNDTLVVMPMHPSYVDRPPYYYGYGYGYGYGYELDGFSRNQYSGGLLLSGGTLTVGSAGAIALPGGAARGARGDAAYSISGNSSFSEVEFKNSGMSHMVPVEIAAANTTDNPEGVRRDFSDSAFWNAHVRTDANGNATAEFKLPDSLTNWQVVVTAVTRDLQVGTAKSKFRTFKPVMVWPMLPRNFTQGDKVNIFASVHNHTDKEQVIKTTLKIDNGELVGSPASVNVTVPAHGNSPVYWTYRAGATGTAQLLMSAECDGGSDASLKKLPVIDASVWEAKSYSGFCKDQVSFTVPEGIDMGMARLEVSVAPSLAADMAETLDYLVDYPYGCVEQTMSRFLPALKVAQILQKFEIKNPSLEAKLPKCMDMGIKRLLELQQPDGGWGWNGSSQTHEMMTPYALYGLLEAEKGGYKIPNEQAVQKGLTRLATFIANMGDAQAADRIYCMYVYSNREKLQDFWWTWIEQQVDRKTLSDYATAMALEMAAKADKKELALKAMTSLRERGKRVNGVVNWTTAKFSRWGDDPNEITAAALKAIVAYDVHDDLVPEILAYFAQTKRGNKWNSTKDTAMILYAMCDYLATQDIKLKGHKVASLYINDGGKKEMIKIEDGLTQKIVFAADAMKPGANTLHFENASGGMMYRAVLRYRQAGSEIKAQDNGIKVVRQFYEIEDGKQKRQLKDGDTVKRGAYIMSVVSANTNLGNELRYVLVENPKPGSCEIQPVEDQRFVNFQANSGAVLREDKEVGVFWHHEQTGGNVHDACVIRCEMSGDFVVAPAAVEMMYRTETRGHSGSFRFTVKDERKVAAK